jgi:hypothetical protein
MAGREIEDTSTAVDRNVHSYWASQSKLIRKVGPVHAI